MANSLRDKVQQRAAQSWGDDTAADAEQISQAVRPPAQEAEPAPLAPFVELTEPTGDDPERVSVFVAWARVMRDVAGVGKNSLFKQKNQNGGETRYNYRGVDAMINAFGPACRRHGVMVIPIRLTPSHAPATSSRGSSMRETTTVVTWRIYGPNGDFIEGESEGESLDTGDKGTAKAQTVALRVFLIAAGLVPTDDKDPDGSHVERGERPLPRAADYRDEAVDPRTSVQRIRAAYQEAKHHGLLTHRVVNEVGEEEELGALILRVDQARQGGGS